MPGAAGGKLAITRNLPVNLLSHMERACDRCDNQISFFVKVIWVQVFPCLLSKGIPTNSVPEALTVYWEGPICSK